MINHDALTRMFEPPEWFDKNRITQEQADRGLKAERVFGMASIIAGIQAVGMQVKSPTTMFEFGSGFGAGLLALDMYAEAQLGDKKPHIIGSERNSGIRAAAQLLTADCKNVVGIATDGITEMREREGQLDLVIAQMFGPVDFKRPAVTFLEAAQVGLATSGVIAIQSDKDTMDFVSEAAAEVFGADRVVTMDPTDIPVGPRLKPRLYIAA